MKVNLTFRCSVKSWNTAVVLCAERLSSTIWISLAERAPLASSDKNALSFCERKQLEIVPQRIYTDRDQLATQ